MRTSKSAGSLPRSSSSQRSGVATGAPGRARVALFRLYFRTLQALGAFMPDWREIYHGLPGLIEETRWLPELQDALRAGGFRDIRVEHLTLYGSAIVSARR